MKATKETKTVGVVMIEALKWTEKCEVATQGARKKNFGLKSAISFRNVGVFVRLYKATVTSPPEWCFQAWAPFFKRVYRLSGLSVPVSHPYYGSTK